MTGSVAHRRVAVPPRQQAVFLADQIVGKRHQGFVHRLGKLCLIAGGPHFGQKRDDRGASKFLYRPEVAVGAAAAVGSFTGHAVQSAPAVPLIQSRADTPRPKWRTENDV